MVAKKEDVDDVSILASSSPRHSSKAMKVEDRVPSGFSTPGSLAESHIVPKTEDILSRSSSPLTSMDFRSSSEIPIPKKRRIMRVEVVVPTLRAVLDKVPAGIERVEEEDDEIMEKLVNVSRVIHVIDYPYMTFAAQSKESPKHRIILGYRPESSERDRVP